MEEAWQTVSVLSCGPAFPGGGGGGVEQCVLLVAVSA